jgi:ankyrin repeat protein
MHTKKPNQTISVLNLQPANLPVVIKAMEDFGAGVLDDAQAGGLSIFETAKVRWLNVEEIITLLSTPGLIQQSSAAPASPPASGSLLLFDRSIVRNFKLDGHTWIKKRNNPNKVREDHVKLRYKGQYRVAGTYVHSVDVTTFHRRAYRFISDPGSAKPVAYPGDDMAPAENTDLVLVHYLDTLEAVRVSALFADHLAAAASAGGGGGRRKKGGGSRSGSGSAAGSSRSSSMRRGIGGSRGMGTGKGMAKGMGTGMGGFPQQIECSGQQQWYQQEQQYQAQQYEQHAHSAHQTGDAGAYQMGQDTEDDRLMASLAMANSGDSDHRRGESLDEGALDILWDMVLEEGGEDLDEELQDAAAEAIEEHLSAGLEAQLMNTVEDAIQDVAASTLSEHLAAVSDDDIRDVVDQVLNEKSGGDGDNTLAEIQSKVMATVEDVLPDSLQNQLVKTTQEKLEGASRSSGSRSSRGRGGGGEDEEMAERAGTPEMPPLPAFAAHVAPVAIDPSQPVAKLVEESQSIPQTPLPEIIDFTPEDGPFLTGKPLKMVISTSSPLPILPPDDPPYRWHLIACFIDIGGQATFANENSPSPNGTAPTHSLPFSPDPLIMKVALTEVTQITPYSYKCYAPRDLSTPGPRSIILTGVRYMDDEAGPIWDAIRVAIKVCIQAEWNVASDMTDPMRKARLDAGGHDLIRPKFFAPAGSGNVQLLSQLSQAPFDFTEIPAVSALPNDLRAATAAAADEGSTGRGSQTKSTSSSNVLAPAPALAVVAAALTQFDNKPPSQAVGEDIPAANNRKRSLTLDKDQGENLVQEANVSAANWADSVVPNTDGLTQREDVNRHCKIRFVERLANVIVGTDDGEAGAAESAAAASTDEGYTDPGLVLNVDGDTNFKDIGDEELDSLLHSVLIRFVEAMVDTSTSEGELKEALNKHGLSGFTLLHYASLYNIVSLVPLLLSRGADPNALTEKGGLTPLHLAAGAGHDQIVDALIRVGSRIAPQDSYGLTPSDHALRCGFNEISDHLVEIAKGRAKEDGETDMSPQKSPDEMPHSSWTLEGQAAEKRENLQSAFKELSLKDKLGLNLFVQRYKRGSDSGMSGGGGPQGAMQDIDELNPSADDFDLNFISEKDRESLRTAMSMMSKDELDELEKNAPYSNVRDWMIKSNYESLRLASAQLEKQAKRRALSASTKTGQRDSMEKSKESSGDSSKQKLSHSKLSQVLAMLVLRKNLGGSDGARGQGQNEARGGQQQQQQEDGGGSAEMETR